MKQKSNLRRDRIVRTFLGSVATGVAAPVLFFSGAFEAPVQLRRSSVADSWSKVGSYMRDSMTEIDEEKKRG